MTQPVYVTNNNSILQSAPPPPVTQPIVSSKNFTEEHIILKLVERGVL